MLKIMIIMTALLLFLSNVFAQQTATVTWSKEYLRGRPDAQGKLITSVKKGDSLELLLERGEWSLVQSKDFVGWIRTLAVSKDRSEVVTGLGGIGTGRGSGTGSGIGNGTGSGVGSGSGIGTGSGSDGGGVDRGLNGPPNMTRAVRIISKPRAYATDEARRNNEEGTVVLRVVFLASGQIGSITVVKGLRFGLNEQAVAAAQKIRFEPALSKGVPKTVSKTIEYSFTYY